MKKRNLILMLTALTIVTAFLIWLNNRLDFISDLFQTQKPDPIVVQLVRSDYQESYLLSTFKTEQYVLITPSYLRLDITKEQLSKLQSDQKSFNILPTKSYAKGAKIFKAQIFGNVRDAKIQNLQKIGAIIEPKYSWETLSADDDEILVWASNNDISNLSQDVRSLEEFSQYERISPMLVEAMQSNQQFDNVRILIYNYQNIIDNHPFKAKLQQFNIEETSKEVRTNLNQSSPSGMQFTVRTDYKSLLNLLEVSPEIILVN